MNREEILAKAQKQTDERELVIKNKAYKCASEVMTLLIGILALYFVTDACILESARTFSGLAIGVALAGVGCVYITVYSAYTGFVLKNKKDILGAFVTLFIAVFMFKEFLGFIL